MSEYIRPIYSIESCQAETRKTGKHNSITTKHGLQRLISGSAIPSLSISVENSVEDDDNVSSSLCSLFLSKHIPYHTPKLVCSMFRRKRNHFTP